MLFRVRNDVVVDFDFDICTYTLLVPSRFRFNLECVFDFDVDYFLIRLRFGFDSISLSIRFQIKSMRIALSNLIPIMIRYSFGFEIDPSLILFPENVHGHNGERQEVQPTQPRAGTEIVSQACLK